MVQIVNPITVVQKGSAYDPTDPQQVYEHTRPTDWLEMPTPNTNEAYILFQIPQGAIDNQNLTMAATLQDTTQDWTVTFGTVSGGVFVPDSDLIFTSVSGINNIVVPYTKFGNTTSDGQNQIMAKITAESPITAMSWNGNYSTAFVTIADFDMVEFRGNIPTLNNIYGTTASLGRSERPNLTYFSLINTGMSTCEYMFYACYSLKAVLQLTTTGATSFQSMFAACYNLQAIPQLDTSSGTNFASMFTSCNNLRVIPQLDTSNGTNFSSMFNNNVTRRVFPQLDTSSGTNFNSMFASCYVMETAPQLDTSSGTNFSSMFSSCKALRSVPQLDVSHGTGTAYQNMFYGCSSLKDVDISNYVMNTTVAQNAYQNMFRYIGGGKTIILGATFRNNSLLSSTNFVEVSNSTPNATLKIKFPQTTMVNPGYNINSIIPGTDIEFYVPDDLVETYKANSYWSPAASRIFPMSDWTA